MPSASASRRASASKLLSLFALLAWGLVVLVATASAAAAERRVALVIGNSNYRDLDLTLINPKNDAEDVAAALRKLNFDVLVTTDADYPSFGRALQKFARMAANADTSLFYYAGHAVQYQGRNYLLPTDAEVKDDIGLEFETVPVDDVLAALKRTNGIKIMVLDACRNNPVADRLAKLPPSPGEDSPPLSSRTRGISRIYKSEGLIIAYAAAPGDVSLDGKGRNSPYTTAFLQWIAQPGLEIETMFRRIAAEVVKETHGLQRPETYVSLDSDYVLNQEDRYAWEQIKDSNDPAAFRDFLKRFPASYYSIEAHYRLDALERAVEDRKQEELRAVEEKRIEAERRALAAAAANACSEAQAKLDALGPTDTKGLEALIATRPCANVLTAAQARLAAARAEEAKEAAACQADARALDAIGARDAKALQTLIDKNPCADVKATATARLAAVKALLAQEADEACRRDSTALAGLGARDVQGLQALIDKTPCDKVKTVATARLAALKAQLAQEAAACHRARAALAQLAPQDEAGLRQLMDTASCAEVRDAARNKLAAIEAERARMAALCQRENDDLKGLAKAGTRQEIQAFRQKAQCPAAIAAADKVIQQLAAADAACARGKAALAAISPQDENSLRDLLKQATCPAVKTATQAELAKLEAAKAAQAKICSQDENSLKALGPDAGRTDLQNLHDNVKCPSVIAAIDKRLSEIAAACTRDRATLAAIAPSDKAGLQSFVAKATCADAKNEAQARIATLEQQTAHEDEICQRDNDKLKALAGSNDPQALSGLRASLHCPATIAALDQKITDLQAACSRETATLSKIAATDADGLRSFLANGTCSQVKSTAQAQLAKLETAEKETCQRENGQLAALQKKGQDGRAELVNFEKTLTCEKLRPSVEAALESLGPEINSPGQIRTAQGELKRLGCFAGTIDGKLDDPTRDAWKHYFERIHRRREARLKPHIDDAFIAQIKQRSARVCPLTCSKGEVVEKDRCVPAPVAREEEGPRVRPRHEREAPRHMREERQAHEKHYRQENHERPRNVARQRSNGRSGGGGGGGGGGMSTSLGIGY